MMEQACRVAPSVAAEADMILTGGTVYTMDASRTVADAIAIRDGLIAAVGSRDIVERLAGPATEMVHLGGRAVIPGIIDTHAHMEREGLKTLRPSLAHARSITDILEVVSAVAAERAPGAWVITMPVGQPPYFFGGPETLAEGRMPNRFELDRAAPDHPVCIAGVFANWGLPPGYTALNSRALALLGIDRDTKTELRGVEIERDPGSGEPTGVIIERNNRPTADFALLRGITGFSFDERLLGLERSMALYNAVGTTSIYEGHGSSPETIAVYRELHERDALTVRSALCVSPTWSSVDEGSKALRDWLPYARGRGLGDAWFRVMGVFVGVGGNATTAANTRAALPNTGWTGFVEWCHSMEDFRSYAFLCAELGLRLNTIVVDKLEEILTIFEEVDARIPLAGRRWVIEHVRDVREPQIPRMRRLGLHVTTIPVYSIWKNGAGLTRNLDDLDLYMPHKALLEAGVDASAGTDNIPYNPFFTLQTLVTRRERVTGRVLGPTQRLDRHEALRLMTSDAARITFEEGSKGTLEVGKLADIAVLTDDPMTVGAGHLGTIEAAMTIVGGQVVHRRAGM